MKKEELVKLHKAFRVLEIWVKQPVLLSYLQAMEKLYSYMLVLYYAIDVLNVMCIRWRRDPSDRDIVTLLQLKSQMYVQYEGTFSCNK